MAEHLTEKEIELVKLTVSSTLKSVGHLCHFDVDERKKIHAFTEVLADEGADHGTLSVIVQCGKSIQNITRKAITWFIIGIVVIVVSVFVGAMIIKP